jgi:hypothetical protein
LKSKCLNVKDIRSWHCSEIWDLSSGLELAGGFVLGAEAPGADVDFSLPSLYHNRSTLNIREPVPVGMLFGMAYTAPKINSLAANFALHRNFSFR